MELTLNKLKGKRLKCNIKKSLFGKTKIEYLGFWVTRDGIKPINIKIDAITSMVPPTPWNEYESLLSVNSKLCTWSV